MTVDGRRPDYVDAFEISARPGDLRPAEEWLRTGLAESPLLLRRLIVAVHRHVLRLRLGPLDGPRHVLGWALAESGRDLARLEADSPLAHAAIVGCRLGEQRVLVVTALAYDRRRLTPARWAVVGPLHRRVAPLLLERAARG